MKKQVVSAIVCVVISTAAYANQYPQTYNQPYYNANPYSNAQATLKGSVFIVPAGSQFPATTTMELNSGNLLLGQAVNLSLGQDFYYDNL